MMIGGVNETGPDLLCDGPAVRLNSADTLIHHKSPSALLLALSFSPYHSPVASLGDNDDMWGSGSVLGGILVRPNALLPGVYVGLFGSHNQKDIISLMWLAFLKIFLMIPMSFHHTKASLNLCNV